MSRVVTIVDYQMGNLRSVQKAIEHVGGTAKITSDPNQIANAGKLILPGVGAFGDAIRELKVRNLVDEIKSFVATGRPFFGICLGMQLLFDTGFEHGEHEGIGLIPGQVVRFKLPPQLKVPHMGWNQVESRKPVDPLMRDLPTSPYFYFVHSYYAQPAQTSDIWLEAEYGHRFCAAIQRDNIRATQFHPEKSQTHGLQLLKNFVAM